MKLQEKQNTFFQTACTKQSLNVGGPQLIKVCNSSSILGKTPLSTSFHSAIFLSTSFSSCDELSSSLNSILNS